MRPEIKGHVDGCAPCTVHHARCTMNHYFFSNLSFTHQREYMEWIEDARKPETRERRKAKMIEMLKERTRTR